MSTYSTNLALELIGTGEQAGTWGNTTNTNLGTLIEQAISGYVTQAVSTGTDTTITIPNGATGVARNMFIELTGTGGTNTNLIVPANKKLYFIYNNASGAVTVKVSGQTGVSVAAGAKVILVSNGTDIVTATSYLTSGGDVSFSSLTVTGNANLATSSGNVGIGTSSPATKLHVAGTIRSGATGASGRVEVARSSDGAVLGFLYNPTSDVFAIAQGSGGSANPIAFYTAGTEKMRLDEPGNLGLGVTPSAWDSLKALQISAGASVSADSTSVQVSNNAYYASGGWTYIGSGNATNYYQNSGQHVWRTAASGTAGNTITFTQAMTLDASGNLGVGATSPAARVHISGTNTAARGQLTVVGASDDARITLYRDSTLHVGFAAGSSDSYIGTESNTPFRFLTNGTERGRFTTTGNLLVGTTTDVSGLSGVISDIAGNVRNIPSAGAAKTSKYTLSITDIGEYVTVGTSGSIDVPNNIFSSGNAVSLYNDTTGNVTVSLTITTAYIAGTNTDKNSVTLATRGLATILFINPSLCVISGNVT